MIISTVLGGIVASLLLGLPVFRGGRSGIVAKVHAQGGLLSGYLTWSLRVLPNRDYALWSPRRRRHLYI